MGQALAASNPRNYQEAETHFARSIEAFETSGAKLYLAQAYTSWGDLYVKQDNSKAGQEKYEKAKALLEAANLTQELEVLSNRMREVASRR